MNILSILSVGFINALSGLKDTVVFSPFDFTEIGLANPISVKSKGEKTTVSLRPERALINPTDKMDNMFTGKIEEVIYHGDHTRVRLDLLGSSEFILKVPNSTSNLELKVKEDINIGWNSVDARALDPK